MIFKRHIEPQLDSWKKNTARKPLIIRGARQVGKTTLVKNFAKNYEKQIFLNLEKKEDIQYFERYNNVQDIKEALFLSHNISSAVIEDTLLFIDEIQESPKAIKLLRYFYEEIPELSVIAAGSLLEFTIRDIQSFPVGRVESIYIHPLNFEEYLNAIKHEAAKNRLLQIPVDNIGHNLLLELFQEYAIIGGMPEVLQNWISTKKISDLPRIYESIWGAYKDDIGKYTKNDTERNVIKHIINNAHLYVDQRIKFQNFGNSNYRSREVSEAFRNLDAAGIIKLIYPSTDIDVPIKTNLRKSPRLQFLDTGILNYALNIQANMLGYDDLNHAFKGAIIPHLITQEIISLNSKDRQKPNFWVREKNQASSEVDLLLPYQNKVIPIEIKSGSAGKLRSLHQFVDQSSHPYAIRMYAGKFTVEQHKTPRGKPYLLMNLPYYLGTQLINYINYFVSNYKI